MQQRKIIHIDMDAFYAAVEQRDFPKYRGKPIVVGGSPFKRGVVATASYEARAFGIHSAMPCARAYRLCPQAIFIRPRFEVYRQVSRDIHAVLERYSSQIEPLSLDEAYLDVSDATAFQGSATLLAKDIKRAIKEKTGITASAGVSYNKFLAKLASDMDKPDGLYLITPEQGPTFVERLPIGKFHGVGKATEAKMKALGIATGADLKTWSLFKLQQTFGKVGAHYYAIARALDERPVVSERIRKSISSETTFDNDLSDPDEMLVQIEKLAMDVAQYLTAKRLAGHTLTIKVRYADFNLVTRSKTVPEPITTLADMQPFFTELLAKTDATTRQVRLLGVGISNFATPEAESSPEQLALF